MTATLSDVLGELHRLHDAATPGPWLQQHYSVYREMDVLFRVDVGELSSTLHDARLIAAMRNALPTLLRVVPALMRVADAARVLMDSKTLMQKDWDALYARLTELDKAAATP